MHGDLMHLPVNWIDGMKISRKHFEDTDRHTDDRVRDVASQRLNDHNFGILPLENSLDLRVTCDHSQQITVELHSCKAITPDGSRIQVLPGEAPGCSINFKDLSNNFNLQSSQSQNLYILISIDASRHIPAGEPELQENPPRHPFKRQLIKLDIIPAGYLHMPQLVNSLVLGKITAHNGELLWQEDFIPSCAAVNSLPALAGWHLRFRQSMDNWELYCIKIIQKINSKVQQQQPTTLSTSIHKLTEKTLEQLVLQKFNYRSVLDKYAPIHFCGALLQNIYYIWALLQCYPEKEREEMLTYFAEWTETQAGAIENQTQRALQFQYNHYDIQALLGEIAAVYDSYILVFQKLSQLDIIGKRKGQHIFVIEQEVKSKGQPAASSPDKPNNRWSPLS